MTPPIQPIMVRCPTCADEFLWQGNDPVFRYDEAISDYEPIDLGRMSESRVATALREGYRKCPNPSGDATEHYLPATYWTYPDPLVIGLVGAPAAGKTHLLTAMIWAAYQHALKPYGIETSALDFHRHHEFERLYMRPFQDGGELAGTRTNVSEAVDILLMRGPGGTRPVTFFDVAGEDLERSSANRATRFLASANAVIFVHGLEDPPEEGRPAASNTAWSFELAVERLRGMPGGVDRIPAVLAVTKADRKRYVPPVDRWLRAAPHGLDAGLIRDQTRDVYAYLHHAGQTGALRPFEAFRRCTMHFVSASGKDSVAVDPGADRTERHFPRGISPMHVLEPLVAILAMTGMLDGPEARKVGR